MQAGIKVEGGPVCARPVYATQLALMETDLVKARCGDLHQAQITVTKVALGKFTVQKMSGSKVTMGKFTRFENAVLNTEGWQIQLLEGFREKSLLLISCVMLDPVRT